MLVKSLFFIIAWGQWEFLLFIFTFKYNLCVDKLLKKKETNEIHNLHCTLVEDVFRNFY